MRNLISLFGALFLMFLFTDASAQKIDDYKWLEGRYLNDAEVNVERMGFTRIDAIQKGRDLYEYYWNTNDKFCLAMVSNLGRIDRVFKGTRPDCHQKADAGGAIAVGAMAAAILGSALLTSKSNDRSKNGVNEENHDEVAAFDRGYRDGMYNHTYNNVYRNVNERNAYSNGYNEGSSHRGQQIAHTTNQLGHVNVSDLYNKNALYVNNQMKARGFEMMNSTRNNWGVHEYWYSYETHQCYDLTITDGKGLEQIRTASAHDCQHHNASYNKAKDTKEYTNSRYGGNQMQYNATGNLSCEINFRGENCSYGVVRHGYNRADVYVDVPGGGQRVFNFNGNRVGTPGGGMSINKTGDTWHLKVGNNKFSIPQSVINGY